jgi:hypothetical protein
MRRKIAINDDVLTVAWSIARQLNQTVGKIVSERACLFRRLHSRGVTALNVDFSTLYNKLPETGVRSELGQIRIRIQRRAAVFHYSHSMVPGGFEVTS